jgi:ADP-ribosylglycohydrolase
MFGRCAGFDTGLRLSQHGVQRPATQRVEARATQVIEDGTVGATGLFHGVAQDGLDVEVARRIDVSGQNQDRPGAPTRREARLHERVAEQLAGAIAAAVAGAYAWKHRDDRSQEATKRGLFELSVEAAARLVGNGINISCADTLPFCVWAAAANLDDYRAAIVRTIRGCGDIDTNCAIVGGIVALAVGRDGIPAHWLVGREELVAGY